MSLSIINEYLLTLYGVKQGIKIDNMNSIFLLYSTDQSYIKIWVNTQFLLVMSVEINYKWHTVIKMFVSYFVLVCWSELKMALSENIFLRSWHVERKVITFITGQWPRHSPPDWLWSFLMGVNLSASWKISTPLFPCAIYGDINLSKLDDTQCYGRLFLNTRFI